MIYADPIAGLSEAAILVGRIDGVDGPTPVIVRQGRLIDVSEIAPTVSELLDNISDAAYWNGTDLGAWSAAFAPRLLSPIDLQCIKAAGVTFADSTLERVIDERARGDLAHAHEIRSEISDRIGTDLKSVRPGTLEAVRLKSVLIADGLWSQYLEVAIGPDAEVFTKAPVLASVGFGAEIGVRSDSAWNNPEPEVVLVCTARGEVVGATLGNDVNLRDIEGRSALLLGKAKDNNASCAIGPFIRLFDNEFGISDVRRMVVRLDIEGEDGFILAGQSSMSQISRDPLDLVGQTINSSHQYPDGFVLFMGTMFAPTQDRDHSGQGFTHKLGDRVRISAGGLGLLENRVVSCEEAAPWTFGIRSLFDNLARRGLLPARSGFSPL